MQVIVSLTRCRFSFIPPSMVPIDPRPISPHQNEAIIYLKPYGANRYLPVLTYRNLNQGIYIKY
jgi:hypothetical protein